jgi:hypothetical protein
MGEQYEFTEGGKTKVERIVSYVAPRRLRLRQVGGGVTAGAVLNAA